MKKNKDDILLEYYNAHIRMQRAIAGKCIECKKNERSVRACEVKTCPLHRERTCVVWVCYEKKQTDIQNRRVPKS